MRQNRETFYELSLRYETEHRLGKLDERTQAGMGCKNNHIFGQNVRNFKQNPDFLRSSLTFLGNPGLWTPPFGNSGGACSEVLKCISADLSIRDESTYSCEWIPIGLHVFRKGNGQFWSTQGDVPRDVTYESSLVQSQSDEPHCKLAVRSNIQAPEVVQVQVEY